jgi:hypothetical protein
VLLPDTLHLNGVLNAAYASLSIEFMDLHSSKDFGDGEVLETLTTDSQTTK